VPAWVLFALVVSFALPAMSQSSARTEAFANAASIIDTTGVTFDPNASIGQLLESAREMFISDSYKLSEMLYKSILIRDPNNLSALLELAVLYEATGQLQYARGLLTRALIINPADKDIIDRNNRIVQHLSRTIEDEVARLIKAGSYDLALPKLSLLLTTQPENAELHYTKAQCHLKLGHPEAAVAELDKALNLSRDKRFKKLKSHAESRVEQKGVKKLTLQARGALSRKTEEGDEVALRLIGEILEKDPDHVWAKSQFVALKEAQESTAGQVAANNGVRGAWEATKRFLAPSGGWFAIVAALFREHVEELLFILLALLVLNSPLTRTLVRGFSPQQSLVGRLHDFSIKEILSLINSHHRTGALKVNTDTRKGTVYFSRGEIYHCKAGRETGRAALQTLMRGSRGGYFMFRDGEETIDRTVDAPLSLILLELPERESHNTAQKIIQKQTRMRELLGSKK
jgi:tetratricopeptide (TPR) repeat protein